MLTICAKCKHSVVNFWAHGGHTCGAPWPEEINLISGNESVPLQNLTCGQNDGQCPQFVDKETGLPLPTKWSLWSKVPRTGDFWLLVVGICLIGLFLTLAITSLP